MKAKSFFIISFLILVIFLSGCNISVIPAIDEMAIKNVIQNYALALHNQEWNKAKNYCVYGTEPYYSVELKENAVNLLSAYCGLVTLTYLVDIKKVSIFGNTAIAFLDVVYIITACGYYEIDNYSASVYLQKYGANWKIYDSEYY